MTDRPQRFLSLSGSRLVALAIAAAFVLTTIGAAAAPSMVLGWDAKSYSSPDEQELFTLTNQARASAGLATLKWDSALNSIARWRSKDMITRNYFSHSIPGAGTVFDEMQNRGYCFKVAGENIGWNTYPDDVATATVQQMFMGSSGHRANILGKAWNAMAVGAYKGASGKMMWTVLFAEKCGSSSTTQPAPKPTAKPKPTPHPTPRPVRTAAPANAAAPAGPTPTPTPIVTPTPAAVTAEPTASPEPTAAPTPTLETASADQSTAGLTQQDLSLQVVDRPAPKGLLETILGGVAGFFFGS